MVDITITVDCHHHHRHHRHHQHHYNLPSQSVLVS
jgi:hypothetical protein